MANGCFFAKLCFSYIVFNWIEMFDNLIDLIHRNWSGFLRLNSSLRAVILAFIVAFSGTLTVTLFSGAATSYYALGLGIKPPIEQIDALQSAVFVWSLKYSLVMGLGLSLVFALLFQATRKELLKRILFFGGLIGFIGLYGYVFILLFSTNQFEDLLIKTRLGGFNNVVLYENLNDKTEIKHECKLVLYTTDAIICYFPSRKTYTQFPISNLQRIDYVSP